MAERQRVTHGFPPFYCADSRLLILGSFPSVKSRAQAFFYGHPQNRFWPVMARLCGEDTPLTVPERAAFLERNRIALYDVLEACTIVGSSDSSIRDVVVNDLTPILSLSRVGRIFVNGKTAEKLYRRYTEPTLGIRAVCLPSTSPANAAWSLQRLTEAWRQRIFDQEYFKQRGNQNGKDTDALLHL